MRSMGSSAAGSATSAVSMGVSSSALKKRKRLETLVPRVVDAKVCAAELYYVWEINANKCLGDSHPKEFAA